MKLCVQNGSFIYNSSKFNKVSWREFEETTTGRFSLETLAVKVYPIHRQHDQAELVPAHPRQACFLFR